MAQRVVLLTCCMLAVQAHPNEFILDQQMSPTCTSHPLIGYGRHRDPRPDMVSTITLTSSAGEVATTTVCPGETYNLTVWFDGDYRQALVSSTYGTMSEASSFDSLRCLNRFVVVYDTDAAITNLTLPCAGAQMPDGSEMVIEVTSAIAETAAYQSLKATMVVDAKCGVGACTYTIPPPSPPEPVPSPKPQPSPKKPNKKPSPKPNKKPSPKPNKPNKKPSPKPNKKPSPIPSPVLSPVPVPSPATSSTGCSLLPWPEAPLASLCSLASPSDVSSPAALSPGCSIYRQCTVPGYSPKAPYPQMCNITRIWASICSDVPSQAPQCAQAQAAAQTLGVDYAGCLSAAAFSLFSSSKVVSDIVGMCDEMGGPGTMAGCDICFSAANCPDPLRTLGLACLDMPMDGCVDWFNFCQTDAAFEGMAGLANQQLCSRSEYVPAPGQLSPEPAMASGRRFLQGSKISGP